VCVVVHEPLCLQLLFVMVIQCLSHWYIYLSWNYIDHLYEKAYIARKPQDLSHVIDKKRHGLAPRYWPSPGIDASSQLPTLFGLLLKIEVHLDTLQFHHVTLNVALFLLRFNLFTYSVTEYWKNQEEQIGRGMMFINQSLVLKVLEYSCAEFSSGIRWIILTDFLLLPII
jgi:hypothetical protein